MVNSVKYLEAPLIFTVKRWVKTIKLKIVPDNWKIGCYVSYNVTGQDKNVIFKYDWKEALKQWFKEVFNQSMQVLETMKIIIKNIVSPGTAYERTAAINSIQWPIGLWDQFIKFVELKMDFSFYLMIAAILSVNLGVFNLLPFPALDGWRFFIMFLNMLLIAACGRKAIDEKVEIFVHIFWFGSLIWLSILVAYMDLLKIFTK
jgi:regulator of sigma E protease